MAPSAGFITHVTCRLTVKNRDQLRNPTLGNRVCAVFFTRVGLPNAQSDIQTSERATHISCPFDACDICCFAGALSALKKTPRNVIIEKGDDVHMECSTDAPSGYNTIIWRYDDIHVTRHTCEAINTTRFSISTSNDNDCNIIGRSNSISGNQGPYECSDGSGDQAEAVAVLIGMDDTAF